MPVAPITFPTTSYPGSKPQESAGRLINAIAEPLGDAGPARAKIIRSPGISTFATVSDTTFRGMSPELSGNVYVAFDGNLYRFNSSGAVTSVGTTGMGGTSRTFFARNNKSPTPDFVLVNGNGAATFTTSSISAFADADLPAPADVCYGLGFFFFPIGDGRIFSTDSEAVTVNSANFTTASSKPDALLRCCFWGDQLYVFGTRSIEVYGRPIQATAFPLTLITTIPYGIAGQLCLTGFEDGMDIGIVFAAPNSQVFVLNGYTPTRISHPDVERDIAAVSDKSTIEMSSFVVGGHRCVKITASTFTWVYDFVTQTWHERKSYLKEYWRGMQAVFAFDKWLCGDTESGKIGEISESVYTEHGDPLIWQVESAPLLAFPNQVVSSRGDFHFVQGTGIASGSDPTQTDPAVMISYSNNGGVTWSMPVLRKLGRQAVADQRVTITRSGTAGRSGKRWRLAVSDPVYVSLFAGTQESERRAA